MDNTKLKFQQLVSKMETIEDSGKGKLRGGLKTLSSDDDRPEGTNTGCVEINLLFCGKKPKEPVATGT